MDGVWRMCLVGTQECAGGMNEGRSSVTFVTKTGVEHFTLQLWQLNKTDHFVYVRFAIFLVQLHQNYYIQSIVKILNCVIKQTITAL